MSRKEQSSTAERTGRVPRGAERWQLTLAGRAHPGCNRWAAPWGPLPRGRCVLVLPLTAASPRLVWAGGRWGAKNHPALLCFLNAPKQRQTEERSAWWAGMRVLQGGSNTASPEGRNLTTLWMPATKMAFPSAWHRDPRGTAVGPAGPRRVPLPSRAAHGGAAGMEVRSRLRSPPCTQCLWVLVR